MELNAIQLAIIGVVATLVIYVVNMITTYVKDKPSVQVIGIVSLVVSILLAGVFLWTTLPKIDFSGDPMEIANQLIVIGTAIMGAATAIYNILFKKILEKLGYTPSDLKFYKSMTEIDKLDK